MSAKPSLVIGDGLEPVSQESEYVHEVYNEIAQHFSQTRYKPWPIVEKFLKSQASFSVGLDVGCGNGKYLNVNKELLIIGTDRSEGLIKCAQELSLNEYNVGIADGLFLPHPQNRFDFAISIAVIHHFATESRRIEAILEILSKLKKGGQCLIYCWALEQENSRRGYKEGDSQDILIPWVLKKPTPKQRRGKDKGKEVFSEPAADCIKKNSPVLRETEPKTDNKINMETENNTETSTETDTTKYRYYHLYKEGELRSNSLATDMCRIVEDGYEKDNWWIILERI